MPSEMLIVLRSFLFDLTSPYTYSDEDLNTLLTVGTYHASIDMRVNDEFTVDITAETIDPDPTADAYKNDNLIILSSLKAACMLSQGEARKAAKGGVRIKDFSFEVDFKDKATNMLSFLKEGYCNAYSKALLQYKLNGVIDAGNIIMGPIRGYC